MGPGDGPLSTLPLGAKGGSPLPLGAQVGRVRRVQIEKVKVDTGDSRRVGRCMDSGPGFASPALPSGRSC